MRLLRTISVKFNVNLSKLKFLKTKPNKKKPDNFLQFVGFLFIKYSFEYLLAEIPGNRIKIDEN